MIGSGEPERLTGAAVSGDLFPALGVPTALGHLRGLTLLMALAGTVLPTLRALRVDPIKAIRAE